MPIGKFAVSLCLAVMTVALVLSACSTDKTALAPLDQNTDFYSEVGTSQTNPAATVDDPYPTLPELPSPEKMGPLPDGFVWGADIIYGRDYRVDKFTEDMFLKGPRITSDGIMYFYPTAELCGRWLTVLYDDGGVGIMRLSCDH